MSAAAPQGVESTSSGERSQESLWSELLAELRRAPLWMILAAAYLFTALTLTFLRQPAARGGALLEGSNAGGVASHVVTWLVAALVGAGLVGLRRHFGVIAACVVGLLFGLFAATWEFDALSAPASSLPRRSVAWLFLFGVVVAPALGAWTVVAAQEFSRQRRESSR